MKKWGKEYKFKTAWVREFYYKGQRWVKFTWKDGLVLVWDVDTGVGRIVSLGRRA